MPSPREAWIHTLSDWAELAKQLLAYAGNRRKFFFYGEMGAGKTTLIQALCRQLGAEDKALSPSFALVNEYAAPVGIIHHLDLFRLRNEQEALDIGVEDYLYDEGYCFVEWPGHVEALAPQDIVRIQITQEGDSVRKVLFL
jgi:tRNA threonylcarbamoyladenosine biosynthesis protein TsaE